MANDNIKTLYNALKNKYDLGSEADFRKSLTNESNRRTLYNTIKDSYDLGSEQDFNKSLGYNTTPAPAPAPAQSNKQKTKVGAVAQEVVDEFDRRNNEYMSEKPSEGEKNKYLNMTNNILGQARQSSQKARNIINYSKKKKAINVPTRYKIGENTNVVKTGNQYITESGNVYDKRGAADLEQNQIDEYKERTLNPIETALRDAYAERDSIDQQMRERMKEIDDENKGVGGFLREFSEASRQPGMLNPLERYQTDEIYRQLESAARKNKATIQTLEDKRDNRMNDFWHSIATTAANGYTFNDGLAEINDAIALMDARKHIDSINTKRQTGEPLTKEEAAAEAVLSSDIVNNDVQGKYAGDYGAWASAGQMVPTSVDFMKDFMLTPGAGGIAKGIARKVSGIGGKYLAKEIGGSAAKEAAKTMARGLLKGTGILLGTHTAGAVISNTARINRTAGAMGANVAGRAAVDENGNIAIQDSMDMLDAFIDAERNQIRETGSEMFGEFIPGLGGIAKKGLEKIGLSKISKTLTNVGNKQWYQQYNKLLTAGGYNGIPGEALEEYEGIAFDALTGNTEEAWNQIKDPRTHIDIWLGTAAMSALLGAVPVTLQGIHTAQYYRYKHNTDKADRVASYRFGNTEKWKSLKDKIDTTPNEQMTDVVVDIMSDNDLYPQQKKAALNYVRNLTKMRGFNIGQMANVNQQSTDNESANNSYSEGYNADDTQLSDIKNIYDLRKEQVANILGVDVSLVDDTIGDPTVFIAELQQLNRNNEIKPILDYVNAKSRYDGMIQRVRDDLDNSIAESNEMIDSRVNRSNGLIQPATMKTQDKDGNSRQAYIINGSVEMLPDGSDVDHEKSSNSILVRYADTGELEMVSPTSIMSIDEPIDPEQERAEAEANITQSFAQPKADAIDGKVSFTPGDTYTLTDEKGQTAEAQVISNADGIVDNGDDTVNLTFDGGQTIKAVSKDDIQSMVDNTNRLRVAAQMESENQQQAQPETRQYNLNEELILQNPDGTQFTATVVDTDYNDGTILLEYDTPQGRRVMPYTKEQLDSMIVPENQTDEEATIEQQIPDAETAQQDETQQPEQPEQPKVPIDENGNVIYEQLDPDTAWDTLVQEAGDEETAQSIADSMVSDAESNLKKVSGKKLKAGTTAQEKLAEARENKQAVDDATALLNHWKAIAGTQKRRQQAIEDERKKEVEEAARIKKEEEEKMRAQKEEEERIKREALKGVPDFVEDTPQDARARGYRRVNGEKIDRQEPITGLAGKEISIKFNDDNIPSGNVAIIDVDALQPSHINGQRNPLHFIDEAQPKERKDDASIMSARKIAENIRPEEITSSVTAYTGAPTINSRGEVIQGNNRSAALKELWTSYPEQAEKYKQYLIDHAEEFGLNPDDIAGMEHPVLVNLLDVSDADAIKLGQFIAQDTESGGIERMKPKNIVQKLGNDIRTFAGQLLKSADEEMTFAALVDKNGPAVLKWLQSKGYITPTQYKSAFNSKGSLTDEAKNDIKGIMFQSIFKDGNTALEEMFNVLPAKAQKAILATAYRDYDSPNADRMNTELQNSIRAYYALSQVPEFANAKNYKDARAAVEDWKRQLAFDDVTGESYLPSERYTNFAILLATMYKGQTQTFIQNTFNNIYDLVQGTQETTLFDQPDNTPRTLTDAINEAINKLSDNLLINNFEYGQQRGNVLAGGSTAGQQRGQRGTGDAASGERAESTGGTSVDNRGTQNGGKQDEVIEQIEQAEADTETNPTEGQKEAGNYKKGHVTIDGYRITIEQPKGSTRRGTDENGKKWKQKMNNTYGYIRGTQSVDGDHIDIFLSDDPTTGNVYVVDQVKPDGTFDKHKVMYGFHSVEEARQAYLSNYEKGWTGLGNITEVSKDEFKKWIDSSHRKTKPFAEYANIKTSSTDWNDIESLKARREYLRDSLSLQPNETSEKEFGEFNELKEKMKKYKGNKTSFTIDDVPEEEKEEFLRDYNRYQDKIHSTYEEISSINDRISELEYQKEKEQKQKEKEISDKEKKESLNGFLANMTNMQAGRTKKILSKLIKIDGKTMPISQHIESWWESGDLKLSTQEVDNLKGPSRRSWNKMDLNEQKEAERKIKEAGKKTVYLVNDYDLGKTAYDYAQFLLNKKINEPSDGQPQIKEGESPIEYAKRVNDWIEGKKETKIKQEYGNNPLKEDEINGSSFPQEIKDGALSYLKGNINFATSIAYQQIYNHVRNTTRDNQADSGTENRAQRTVTDDENGRRGSRPSGGKTEPMGNEPKQGQNGLQNREGSDVLPNGTAGNTEISTTESQSDRVPPRSIERGGSSRAGIKRSNVRKSEAEGYVKTDTARNTGRKDTNSERNKIIGEINSLLDDFVKAGKENLSLSVIGMNAKQIEIAGKLLVAGVRLGYTYIKDGITKFNDWKDTMRNKLAVPFSNAMKLTDAEIDEFINDMWEYPYTINNETKLLKDWAAIMEGEKLRKEVRSSLEEKRKAQLDAEGIPVKVADIDNIKETLPYLLPQQHQDVQRAEVQFFDPSHNDRDHAFGKGYLFTNGTGTGKTYTGLGIVKRFIKQGKKRILILTPSQTKVSDWVSDAKNLNIELTPLESTKDKGDGPVITTFANLRTNKALMEDDFDLVVYDESHRIMENKSGEETAGARQHYMLTNKNVDTALRRLESFHPLWLEEDKLRKRLDDLEKMVAVPDMMDDEYFKDKGEIEDIKKRLEEIRKEQEKVIPELTKKAEEAVKKTKVVFLSATPFNTIPSLDYAEGYIFSYPEENKNTVGSYNHRSPKEEFLEQHFGAGYRFRYGRIESHIENSESLSQQEVQFSDYLENTLQTKSGRIIDSEYDYSRDFPTVTFDMAPLFNGALNDVYDYEHDNFGELREAFNHVFYDYNYSTALFETMKISAIIPRIKKHLDMGRKVVVFHRRVSSQNKIEPPFHLALDIAANMANSIDPKTKEGKEKRRLIFKQINDFKDKYSKLLDYELKLDYNMPREQLAKEFGKDNVLFFSGNETKKEKNNAVKMFNDDNSGKNIIVIQEASGKEGISLHDTTGKHQRVLITLALPQSPITALQIEGRIYRIGNKSNAIFEYPLLGLNLETTIFGSKFNNQVSTTENLALGSNARNLRDSFAEGVIQRSGDIPLESQGVGGKDFDNAGKQQLDNFDKSVLDYYGTQKLKGSRKDRAGIDYFPTPEPIGYKMVEWAMLQEGEDVLEPSAGHGAIARYVPATNGLTAIEPSSELFPILQLRAGGNGRKFINQTFEMLNQVNKFDVVLMNPPYGSAGSTALNHVKKAFDHLNEGGRLIAIIPEGAAAKKFVKWFDETPAACLVGEVKLPDVTFNRAGTSVMTRVIVVDKVSREETRKKLPYFKSVDLRSVDNIDGENGLFESIRDISMPKRTIDEVAIDMKNAKKTVKEFKDIKGVDSVTINDEGISIDGRYPMDIVESWDNLKSPDTYVRYNNLYQNSRKEDRKDFYGTILKTIRNITGKTEDQLLKGSSVKQSMYNFSIDENTRTGEIMYLAVPTVKGSLSNEEYRKISSIASNRGGYWSRFKKAFNFNTEEDAKGFISDINDYMNNNEQQNTQDNDDSVLYRESNDNEINSIIDKAKGDGTYMKAPNGNSTNLNERQWAQVRTKPFKDWFGDWENDPDNASKVVDENGEPKVVYHGTENEFTIFGDEFSKNAFDETPSQGYMFTDDESAASVYGNTIPVFLSIKNLDDYRDKEKLLDVVRRNYNEFNNLTDVFYFDNEEDAVNVYSKIIGYDGRMYADNAGIKEADEMWHILQNQLQKESEDQGFDGFIINDSTRGDRHESYCAYYPNQIKSATENVGTFSTEDDDIRYREITDKEKINELESQPKVKVFRAMQLQDGKLLPPMSGKVKTTVKDSKGNEKTKWEWREPTKLGVWEEAEERPDLANDDNTFTLNKGSNSIKAAYNPYIHTSRSPINDQFSSAWDRDELVTVEVEVPESELTSGYKANKAKDAVGEVEWKSGPIGRQLAKIGKPRLVILSRWDKPIRILPVDEVANEYSKILKGTNIEVPFNTVTPELRDALVRRGVKIGAPENNNAGRASINAYNEWISKQNYTREGNGPITDNELSIENDPVSKMLGKSTRTKAQQKKFAERERQRMEERVREHAEKLHLDNVDIITDASTLEGRRAIAKGFYSRKTGRITIVIPNHTSVFDAEQTLLHEAVAHYGLRKLFGTHFDTFLNNVFNNADEDVRARIVELAKKHNWDFATATEEYLASLAENTNFENINAGWWSKIKDLFIRMLHSIGFENFSGVTLSDNELRYILWRSYENLAEPGRYRSILGEAEDIAKQSELKVGNYAVNNASQNAADDLYRDGDPEVQDRVFARRRYEERVKRGMYQAQEAIQDSMLGLQEAMQAILKGEGKKNVYIEDVPGFENAYLGENRLSSINQAEADAFANILFNPLLKEVSSLAPNKEAREELTDYMMAKHGLERNRVMAERDAQAAYDTYIKKHPNSNKTLQDFIDKYRKKDYAGLTALTATDNVSDAELEAQQMVDAYESNHNTDNLWKKTKAVSDAILSKLYDTGMMSKDTYDKIQSMYDYYIPLRGFDQKTSEEAYAYLNSNNSAFNAPIKTARGRKSKADDPFAYLQSMAESAIMQGNRNKLVKQRFLNFALNHPSDLVSISDIWLKHNDITDEWEPVFPDNIESTDTAEEVERKMKDFEEKMSLLAEQDPEMYKHGKDAINIPYRVVNSRELHQHQVIARRNGRDYVITINGNPRAAQALNGQTNPDNNLHGSIGQILDLVGDVNRTLSSVYTTLQPDFIASNFLRDTIFANSMVWIKESPKYAVNYNTNFSKLPIVRMKSLLAKYRKGNLDMNNEIEKMFYEFIINGGETGFLRMADIDKHKEEIEKLLKAANDKIPLRLIRESMATWIGEVGRGIEMRARFAAYVTSRNAGRSIDRSIWDAKEISVNFNKKGSGDRFLGATGQTAVGNAAAAVAGTGRILYIFWNAGIQGMFGNFAKYAKRHPAKMATAAAIWFALGLLIPALASSDGDDDDNYFDNPKHIRRQNLIIKGYGRTWIKIPLPIEYRAIYGMGELAGSTIFNNEKLETTDMLSQLSQLLPIDVMEGKKALYPSSIKPVVDVSNNETWYGTPIWKDTPYNKYMPEWTKAYKSTNKDLIELASVINELSGGNKYRKGAVDLNPAAIEYLLKQYTGGFFTFTNQILNLTDVSKGEKEFDWRYVPLANRMFMTGADERNVGRGLDDKFFDYMDYYKSKSSEFSAIKNDRSLPLEKKAELITEIISDPDYLKMKSANNAFMKLNNAYKMAKEEGNEKAAEELNKQIYTLKHNFVSSIEKDIRK